MHDREMRSADFLAQTLVRSHVVSAADVDQAQRRIVGERSAEQLARELVARGRLTEFQAAAILRRGVNSLICGDYIILDKLGRGGMGQVYKAMHGRMNRIVALKLLTKHAANSLDIAERFRREVEAAARLDHPNIVTAYDARIARQRTYLVMEHIDGCDLNAVVDRDGPLPVNVAIDYVLQAARGLDYAHQQGIVHRDVKPSNLIVDAAGVVKVLDLGVARMQSPPSDEFTGRRLTRDGQMLGTVAFMAPEQAASSHDADERADIYSLGCTLFYLLTARLPFRGASIADTLHAHRTQAAPSLSDSAAPAAARLQQTFERTVAKDPRHRYASMAELIQALEWWVTDCQRQNEPSSPPSGNPSDESNSRWRGEPVSADHATERPAPRLALTGTPRVRIKRSRRRTRAAANSRKHARRGLTLWVVGAVLATVLSVAFGARLAVNSSADAAPRRTDPDRGAIGSVRAATAVANGGTRSSDRIQLADLLVASTRAFARAQRGWPRFDNATTTRIAAPQHTARDVEANPKAALARGTLESSSRDAPSADERVADGVAGRVVRAPGWDFSLTILGGGRSETLPDLHAAQQRLEEIIAVQNRAADSHKSSLGFVALLDVQGQRYELNDADQALEICRQLDRSDVPADGAARIVSAVAGPPIDVAARTRAVEDYVRDAFEEQLADWSRDKQRLPDVRDVRRIVMKTIAVGKERGLLPANHEVDFSNDKLNELVGPPLAEHAERFQRAAQLAQAVRLLQSAPPAPPPPPRPKPRR